MTSGSLPWQFDRPFKVWSYQVSHSTLLLRSVQSNTRDARVDVMFRSVRAVRLGTNYPDLILNLLSREPVNLSHDFGVASSAPIFSLASSDGSSGLVAAGGIYFAVDDLDYGQLSSIDNPELRPHQSATGTFIP